MAGQRKLPRDRAGEIFQDELTENAGPSPAAREEAAHHLTLDPSIDSQEADAFMIEHFAPRRPT